MKNPKKIALKRLKRKRMLHARKVQEQKILASGKIIMFGRNNKVIMQRNKAKAPKKPKVVKEVKPYRAVKLTAKLDRVVSQIRSTDSSDPKLVSLKAKRDLLKKKLNLK